MASTRRSSRRAEKGHAAAEDHGTCWLCNGVTTMDDYDWLCLCTSEKKRVHKVCVTHRSSLGGPALKPCPHCGMGNSAAEIEHARASSRVVIVGAGAAGLAAARWLKERGFNPLVLEARDRVGGRIHTVEMENGAPVDLGAAYIHGCDASYNPVPPPRPPQPPHLPLPPLPPGAVPHACRPVRNGTAHAHRAAPNALLHLASEARLQPYAPEAATLCCTAQVFRPMLHCAGLPPRLRARRARRPELRRLQHGLGRRALAPRTSRPACTPAPTARTTPAAPPPSPPHRPLRPSRPATSPDPAAPPPSLDPSLSLRVRTCGCCSGRAVVRLRHGAAAAPSPRRACLHHCGRGQGAH